MHFPELISNPRIKLFSWFREAPTQIKPILECDEEGEFSVDTCLTCGTRSKVILKSDGYYTTCIRCGWVERKENLNEVEFGPEITAEIFKPEDLYDKRNNGFTIGWASEVCSGAVRRSAEPCPPCPKCKSRQSRRCGTSKNINGKVQRYLCGNCSKTFSDDRTVRFGHIEITSTSRLPIAKQELVLKQFSCGNSARQVARDVGIDIHTAWQFGKLIKSKYDLRCSCGKPTGSPHACAHILLKSPRRLNYLRGVSPKWRSYSTDPS